MVKFMPPGGKSVQDFAESWTDEKLYKKYGLSREKIEFIESMIRPMDVESLQSKNNDGNS